MINAKRRTAAVKEAWVSPYRAPKKTQLAKLAMEYAGDMYQSDTWTKQISHNSPVFLVHSTYALPLVPNEGEVFSVYLYHPIVSGPAVSQTRFSFHFYD